MDYIDDSTTRPRFQFQSRPSAAAGGGGVGGASSPDTLLKIGRVPAAACFTSAALLLIPAAHLSPHPLSLLLLWISLSLLAGPFAPASLTFGDPTVGRGPPLPPPSPATSDSDDNAKKPHPRRQYKSHDIPPVPAPVPVRSNQTHKSTEDSVFVVEEEWGEGDYELLKKQLVKHPVGAPQRWERVAEAFKGRHGLDSVIRTAKSLSEKRPGDSFAQFLKQRKPLDKRAEAVDGDVVEKEWTGGEDIALLNALKAFPKEAPLRWEKVAAAVPGRSKAECVKRVGELKRDFRSSKGTEA